MPASPWGTFREVSRTSRAFSPKMARSSFSSAVASASPLGGDLAHQIVAGPDLGAHPDDAVLVQVLQGVLAHVGDVPGDGLGAQLGVPGLGLVLLDVDGGEHVVPDHPLVEEDGVLVVIASQVMKPMRMFRPRAISPWSVEGPSASTSWNSTRWPASTMGRWLMQVVWLERRYLSGGYSLVSPLS